MVKLIAIRQGFYGGDRIRRGQAFDFDEARQVQARDAKGKPAVDDKGQAVMVTVKLPRWAAPKERALSEIAKAVARETASTDTKPAAAQKTAVQKARAAQGTA